MRWEQGIANERMQQKKYCEFFLILSLIMFNKKN